MAIKIITDNSCDIDPKVEAQFNIHKIPLYINIGEKSYLEGVDITREQFYAQLPTMKDFPKTAAPSPETFIKAYRQAQSEGFGGVLSIHVSGRLSATINSAYLAEKEITDFSVKVIDSQNLSGGAGFVVEAAARAAKEGHSLEQVVEVINNTIPRTYTFAILDGVDHLQHSGRMGQFITTLGSVLKIRLMLKMNRGRPGAEQFRTHKKGMERLGELIHKLAPFEKFVFLHANAPDSITEIKDIFTTLLGSAVDYPTMVINPVLGSHLGPTAVGFSAVTQNFPDASIFEKSLQSIKLAASKFHLPDVSNIPNPFDRKSGDDKKE